MELNLKKGYESSFFRIWKERFTGVSPIIVKAVPSNNGSFLLYKLVFDSKRMNYRKTVITYTADEIQNLNKTMSDLGHKL